MQACAEELSANGTNGFAAREVYLLRRSEGGLVRNPGAIYGYYGAFTKS
jgi:hypothetical protein